MSAEKIAWRLEQLRNRTYGSLFYINTFDLDPLLASLRSGQPMRDGRRECVLEVLENLVAPSPDMLAEMKEAGVHDDEHELFERLYEFVGD